MQTLSINELKDLKTELGCKLNYITISPEERIELRSSWYRVSTALYYAKKHAKAAGKKAKKLDGNFHIVPIGITDQKRLPA